MLKKLDRYKIDSANLLLKQEPVEGWLHPGNIKMMQEQVVKSNVIVELGSWYGKSAIWFAEMNPDATIICIDHWRGSLNHHYDESANDWFPRLETLYETFKANIWDFRNRIIPIKANSIDGLKIISYLGIKPDMIYLDAGHTFDDVTKEIETIINYIPSCLQIFGDDYNWPEVQKAVDAKFKYAPNTDEKYNDLITHSCQEEPLLQIDKFETNETCWHVVINEKHKNRKPINLERTPV